ncbi:hypothetical protein LXJ58_33205, partial [Escherichia coli]|nr:hypothetical protein [Escherichia coli]
ELLPISSTAHMRLVPALLGWQDPGSAFSAAMQLAALTAVICYFRRDIYAITGGSLSAIRTGDWMSPKELEKFTELKNIIGQGGVRWQMPERVRERIVSALSHEIDGELSSSPASAYRPAPWRAAVDFIKRWSFVPS